VKYRILFYLAFSSAPGGNVRKSGPPNLPKVSPVLQIRPQRAYSNERWYLLWHLFWGGRVRSQNWEKRLLASSCLSFCPSVRPSAWNNSAHTKGIFYEISYFNIVENLSRTLKFHKNLTRLTGTWHEDLCTFMIISRWIPLRTRNVSDENCRENQNTHFMFSNIFFPLENRAVCVIMWTNVVLPERPQVTI